MTSTATALRCAPAEETYHDVAKLLYQTVHAFRRRYGGAWDDLLSDAHLGFCRAYRGYRPEKARFSTWVRNTVWFAMLQGRCDRLKAAGREAPLPPRLEAPAPRAALAELSADAALVVRLALEGARPAEATPAGVRAALADALADMGWCGQRVLEAVAEIREALG